MSDYRVDRSAETWDRDSEELVSVVIPCYNKAAFLGEAIESVLHQTYTHFEVIVVDDGSSDDSRMVASQYPRVRYLYQFNQGPSAARNAGIRASRGNYLVFLDGDDRLLPTALEVDVRALEDHPECAFVSGHVHLIDKDGSYIRTPEESCIASNHYRTLLQYNYIWTPAAVMFRRDIVASLGGYSPDRHGAEDWDLYLRITKDFPVYCHDKVVSEYRVYENQMASNSRQMLKDSLACLHQQWTHIKGNRQLEEAYRMGIQTTRNYYGEPLVNEIWMQLKAARWTHALIGMIGLLRYDPYRFLRRIFRVCQHSTTP